MFDKIKKLTDDFWVAPQIAAADIANAAAMGVTLIVNNRLDGEAPGQPDSAEMEAAAQAAGIAYAHIPIGARGVGEEQVAALDEARKNAAGGATVAFCASGLRSALVYAYAQAQAGRPAADIIAEAAAAGYDSGIHGRALTMFGAQA